MKSKHTPKLRRLALRLTRNDMLQVWRDSIVGHQTTINSRQKAQYERIITACDAILYIRRAAPDALIVAFVQGAQWWEYHKTGATMWASDRAQAEDAAETRAANGTLGRRT